MCAVAGRRAEVVDAMSPCDHHVSRHCYPRLRPRRIAGASDPLSDARILESDLRDTTPRRTPRIVGSPADEPLIPNNPPSAAQGPHILTQIQCALAGSPLAFLACNSPRVAHQNCSQLNSHESRPHARTQPLCRHQMFDSTTPQKQHLEAFLESEYSKTRLQLIHRAITLR